MKFAVEAQVYDSFVGRYGEDLGHELPRAPASKQGCAPSTWERAQGSSRPCWPTWSGRPTSVPSILRSFSSSRRLCRAFPRPRSRKRPRRSLTAEGSFDAVFAQLVVNFMRDAERGVSEMRRVAAEGGVLAASVWDYPAEMGMLTTFWRTAAQLNSAGAAETDERTTMGFDEPGELDALWRKAGLRDVQDGEIVVSVSYSSFEELWESLHFRCVGPAGAYATALLRTSARISVGSSGPSSGLPAAPSSSARAWYAVGTK